MMTPRGDNALFYGLAIGALTAFVIMPLALGPLLDVLFRPTLLTMTAMQWGLSLVSGFVAYYVTWKREEARQRRREGRCVDCGYDLTGNVSGRCPECGQAIDCGRSNRQS